MTANILRCRSRTAEPAEPLRRNAQAVLVSRHPADPVEDAMVVLSELVQNVSQHTTGGGVLTLSWAHDNITVAVRGRGHPAAGPQPPDGHRPGGRGLLLITGLCSSWGTTTYARGKTVWARIAVVIPAFVTPQWGS